MKVFTALLFLIQVFLGYSIPLFGLSIIVTFIIYIQIYCPKSSPRVTLSFKEWQTTKLFLVSGYLCRLLNTIRSCPVLVQQEGILHAHACIRWTTIAWAHQIWWREIEKSRKGTVLLKAISLVLWTPYFPTKNILHDKNRTFSTRAFHL